MSPEDGFTKASKKRLKVLRRIIDGLPDREDCVFIAGRERQYDGVSDVVYMEARGYNDSLRYRFRRMPSVDEVGQVQVLLATLLRAHNLTPALDKVIKLVDNSVAECKVGTPEDTLFREMANVLVEMRNQAAKREGFVS